MTTHTDTLTAPATTDAKLYVGLRYNELNTTYLRVTGHDDGTETLEWIGRDHADRAEAEAAVDQARTMAAVTGSREASYTARGITGRWFRNAHAVGRVLSGTHRAVFTADAADPAQAELRAEHNRQSGASIPAEGDRYVVAELTGYTLVQNRPLEHRDCACGNGVTTYYAGTVSSVTHYADNSIEAVVAIPGRPSATVTLVAPHGDACF